MEQHHFNMTTTTNTNFIVLLGINHYHSCEIISLDYWLPQHFVKFVNLLLGNPNSLNFRNFGIHVYFHQLQLQFTTDHLSEKKKKKKFVPNIC